MVQSYIVNSKTNFHVNSSFKLSNKILVFSKFLIILVYNLPMWKRILSVFLLDKNVFSEIASDPQATIQAAIIIFFISFIAAINALIFAILLIAGSGIINTLLGYLESLIGFISFRIPLYSPLGAFIKGFFGGFVSWFLWALLTYLPSKYLFKCEISLKALLRIIGFARAPLALSGFSLIAGIGWLPALIGWIWSMIASLVGIHQVLKLSVGRTVFIVFITLIIVYLIDLLVMNPLVVQIF